MSEQPSDHLAIQAGSSLDRQTMGLLAGSLLVRKRMRNVLVKVVCATDTQDQVVEEHLVHDRIVVGRVAVGPGVEAMPPIRQKGDVIIPPVVEKAIVVVRRRVLKEKFYLRRVPTIERHTETVKLRRQHATITRNNLEDSGQQDPAARLHDSIDPKEQSR